MQQRIDEGLRYCEPCQAFGWHTFCGECGRRYLGADLDWRECPKCKTQLPTTWCSLCGAQVVDDFLRRMERGEVDWAAEAQRASEIVLGLMDRHPQLATYGLLSRAPETPSALAMAIGLAQRG